MQTYTVSVSYYVLLCTRLRTNTFDSIRWGTKDYKLRLLLSPTGNIVACKCTYSTMTINELLVNHSSVVGDWVRKTLLIELHPRSLRANLRVYTVFCNPHWPFHTIRISTRVRFGSVCFDENYQSDVMQCHFQRDDQFKRTNWYAKVDAWRKERLLTNYGYK